MTPKYESMKKFQDLHSHPPSMKAEKENFRKIFEKWEPSKKIQRKRWKLFTKIFPLKMPQWFHRLFLRSKVPFTEFEPKNGRRYPKNHEDSQYERNGDRLIPKKTFTQTSQKYWRSRFSDGKKDKNFIQMIRHFMWWNFQVMLIAFLSNIYHSWPEKNSVDLDRQPDNIKQVSNL